MTEPLTSDQVELLKALLDALDRLRELRSALQRAKLFGAKTGPLMRLLYQENDAGLVHDHALHVALAEAAKPKP